VTISWFEFQNQVGYNLSAAPQNRRVGDNVRHASRSSGLLRVEASRDRISQFTSKLTDARRWVVHVASLQRSCEDQVEDGRIDITCCI
jgi:hypothetical protein